MGKVFLDTNILLDVMAQREPYNKAANEVMRLGIEGRAWLCVTPLTFANCAYILKSTYKKKEPITIIQAYKQYITALPMDEEQCELALYSGRPGLLTIKTRQA